MRAWRRVLGCGVTMAVVGLGSAAPGYADVGQHTGITITSNASFQSCGCVSSGSGTAASPYVIGPWAITAPNSSGSAITVDNSSGAVTDYFTLTGISVNYNDSNPTDITIHLTDVKNATTVSNVSANADGIGIE